MTENTPSPLGNVITIDDERIKDHLDQVVRGTVEDTLNPHCGSAQSFSHSDFPDPILNNLLKESVPGEEAYSRAVP